MSKPYKVLWVSILVAIIATALIIVLPNSIYEYYVDPAINDLGGSYYFWKFLPEDVDMTARITGWVFFILHFVTVGILLKKLKETQKEKVDGVNKYNYYLLFANLFFVVLHYIHTWIWYDALAQDTPVWSSQGSVIIMLVLILIMENGRRGLFFGKKVPLPKESVRFIMKNHGVYIALATIFTFWFHPMEFTWGHLFGFLYMYLLFIQMSMARTKVHNNYIWKFVLEITVLFHGTLIAIDTANAPWAMFFFGFATVFFVTQIYGLKLHKMVIMVSQIMFLVIVLATYTGIVGGRSIADINEVFRIPVIDYILVFVFVFVIYVPIFIKKKIKESKEPSE